MLTCKTYTHVGVIRGCDVRAGDRTRTVHLRLTPSGSHYVTSQNERFPAKHGRTRESWPMWYLDVESIRPLLAPVTK